jgi:hypothetical protein
LLHITFDFLEVVPPPVVLGAWPPKSSFCEPYGFIYLVVAKPPPVRPLFLAEPSCNEDLEEVSCLDEVFVAAGYGFFNTSDEVLAIPRAEDDGLMGIEIRLAPPTLLYYCMDGEVILKLCCFAFKLLLVVCAAPKP